MNRGMVAGMVLGAGLLACWPMIVAESDDGPTAVSDAPASQPATRPVAVAPAFAVLDYFQQRCANCHGPYGAYYLPELKQRYSDEALRDLLDEMARGPAQSPLTEPQLDQMARFHAALADGVPYVALTARDGQALAGEVSPGHAVAIVAGDATMQAEVTGHRWTATLPEGIATDELELHAQNEASGTN